MIEKERKNDHADVRYIYNKFVSRLLQQGLYERFRQEISSPDKKIINSNPILKKHLQASATLCLF